MKNRSNALLWGVCCLSALVVLGGAGCRSGGSSRNDASVRLIDAAPDAQDLSVSVDGQCVWKHAAFRSNTGFQGVGAGTYQINIGALVNGEKRAGSNYLLSQKGKAYTVVALGPSPNSQDPPALRIFEEGKGTPVPLDKVRLRFINAGDGAGPVDVLFNNIVAFADVPITARTSAVLLDPGEYGLKVNAADDVVTLAESANLHLLPGRAYTLVAMGKRGPVSDPPGMFLEAYPDDQ